MDLLQEIHSAIIDSSIPLTSVLRRCKVLAVRQNQKAFKEWIDQELKGYPSIRDIPEYRIIRDLNCYGDFISVNRSAAPLKGMEISFSNLDEAFRQRLTLKCLNQGVNTIENLATRARQSEKGILNIDWPTEIAKKFTYGTGDWICTRVWTSVPVVSITGVLEAIRDITLDFVLDIESKPFSLGDIRPSTHSPSQSNTATKAHTKSPQITTSYINNFYGTSNISNLANQVNDSAHQEATQNIDQLAQQKALAEMIGEMKELVKQLKQVNPTAKESEKVVNKVAHTVDETAIAELCRLIDMEDDTQAPIPERVSKYAAGSLQTPPEALNSLPTDWLTKKFTDWRAQIPPEPTSPPSEPQTNSTPTQPIRQQHLGAAPLKPRRHPSPAPLQPRRRPSPTPPP